MIHERRGGTAALDVIRTFDRFTGRLESVCSGGSCGIQDDRYAFDAAGNLIRRDIGGQYAEVFSYDPLNRLTLARYERVLATTWSPDTGPVSTEQRYDALGNICQKTIGTTQQNYSYGGRAGCGLGGTPGSGTTSSIASPHAVTAAAGGVFFYDGHGNQVTADYAGTASDRFIRYSVEQQAHEIALASQTSPSQRSRFWYGSDGQRYKREDTATGQSTKRTLYLGSVEIIQQGGVVTTKRYIAGIVVQDITATATTTQYLFHDHIGSIVRVTNASGGIIEGMDFGAFGERRGYVDPRNLPVFPVSTNRGFTGHEMLDGLDVVHMNGRIYDSKLGRFLQADPIIQEPNNGQNFNRYSYVLNNPLSYTDPSGFSFLKKFRTFAAIAVAIAAPYAAAALQGVAVASLAPGTAFAAAAAGGFASGVISGGSLRSGLFGAFSATLFFGIGETFASVEGSGSFFGTGLEAGDFGAKVLAHGIAGGVMAGLQGGNFGHGFVSAGVTQAFSGRIDRISGTGASGARVAAAAVVGGTASVLSGGKFANGALTGAFSRAFNDEIDHNSDASTDDLILTAEEEALLVDLSKGFDSPDRATEQRILINNDGSVVPVTSDNCGPSSCAFTPAEIANARIVLHLHNIYDRSNRLGREFPSGGDATIVTLGTINAVSTPSGAIRVIERVGGALKVRTISGGNLRFNSFVARTWRPHMTDAQIAAALRRFRE